MRLETPLVLPEGRGAASPVPLEPGSSSSSRIPCLAVVKRALWKRALHETLLEIQHKQNCPVPCWLVSWNIKIWMYKAESLKCPMAYSRVNGIEALIQRWVVLCVKVKRLLLWRWSDTWFCWIHLVGKQQKGIDSVTVGRSMWAARHGLYWLLQQRTACHASSTEGVR